MWVFFFLFVMWVYIMQVIIVRRKPGAIDSGRNRTFWSEQTPVGRLSISETHESWMCVLTKWQQWVFIGINFQQYFEQSAFAHQWIRTALYITNCICELQLFLIIYNIIFLLLFTVYQIKYSLPLSNLLRFDSTSHYFLKV